MLLSVWYHKALASEDLKRVSSEVSEIVAKGKMWEARIQHNGIFNPKVAQVVPDMAWMLRELPEGSKNYEQESDKANFWEGTLGNTVGTMVMADYKLVVLERETETVLRE